MVRQVFKSLGKADIDVFFSMERVAMQLQEEATQVLNMVIQEERDTARKRVLGLRKELGPLRLGMTGTLQKLYSLKRQFINISDVA